MNAPTPADCRWIAADREETADIWPEYRILAAKFREDAAVLRAAADQLEAVQLMADEAERVAREEPEWWNPRDVAKDLRRALAPDTAPEDAS